MGIRYTSRHSQISTLSLKESITLRIELLCLEVVLRDVHVTSNCPQVKAEHLAPVLELHVGALAVDLPRKLLIIGQTAGVLVHLTNSEVELEKRFCLG